jgi:hypothetical protein
MQDSNVQSLQGHDVFDSCLLASIALTKFDMALSYRPVSMQYAPLLLRSWARTWGAGDEDVVSIVVDVSLCSALTGLNIA